MIVKNEERVLSRCLDSLKGLFEEIVIVDTGSDDGTKDIAGKYTDKVYDFEWIDDFSAARNYAFSLCTKEYIYCADADEVLDETNRQRFLELKNTLVDDVEIVQMWYINTKDFVTTENFDRELRPKLYKRLREFKWIDPVHESVNLNPVVYDSGVEILHMPLDVHSHRDFGIFKKSIARGERLSSKLHMMYARELMLSGTLEDLGNAADYFTMAAVDDSKSEEDRTDCYIVLSRYYRLKGDISSFFKWAMKNICTKPCSDICYEIGVHYYEEADYEEALCWFQNAISETEPSINAATGDKLSYEMIYQCYKAIAANNDILEDYYLEQAELIKKTYLE